MVFENKVFEEYLVPRIINELGNWENYKTRRITVYSLNTVIQNQVCLRTHKTDGKFHKARQLTRITSVSEDNIKMDSTDFDDMNWIKIVQIFPTMVGFCCDDLRVPQNKVIFWSCQKRWMPNRDLYHGQNADFIYTYTQFAAEYSTWGMMLRSISLDDVSVLGIPMEQKNWLRVWWWLSGQVRKTIQGSYLMTWPFATWWKGFLWNETVDAAYRNSLVRCRKLHITLFLSFFLPYFLPFFHSYNLGKSRTFEGRRT